MTYEETLDHIYSLGRFGIKPGLERITSLLRALRNPHENVTALHLAGTNGKGSTAAFLAAILAEAGLKVGLYTSPHLIRFTERIRINGVEIGESEVVSLAEQVLAAAPAGATFFEIVTAMALAHFARESVDLAVMETGLGGRLDATNVVSGAISIITPISLDHCEYLGDTVAAIAFEKAGIIKAGNPVVVSSQRPEALVVIEERCRALGAPLYRFGRDYHATWENGLLTYQGMGTTLTSLHPGIGGSYQAENAAAALAAAELLAIRGINIPVEAFRRGIEQATWPGRMECLGEAPRYLLDGAHNPDSAAALARALSEVPRERLILVIGVMGDKDIAALARPLLALADVVLAVAPRLPRAMSSADLTAFCRAEGAICFDAGSVPSGLAMARSRAALGDLVLVTGSLFTVGEARAVLLDREFEPFRG